MDQDPAVPSRRARHAQTRRWWRTRAGHIAIIATVALVLLTGFDVVANDGRIHRGVTVGGIDVGGMTKAAARSALASALPRLAAKPVVLTAEGYQRTVSAKQLGLKFDYDALVAAAYAHGRNGGVAGNLADRVAGWWSNTRLTAIPTADPKKLTALLAAVASSVDSEPVDAKVVIEGAKATLQSAQMGVSVDRDRTGKALLKAFTSEQRDVAVAKAQQRPRIGDAAAQTALTEAQHMLSGPVTIVFEGKSWKFTPEEIATWVVVAEASQATSIASQESSTSQPEAAFGATSATSAGTNGSAPALQASIDPVPLSKLVAKRLGAVGHPAKDATFRVSNGTVSIVPSRDGVGADMDALARELTQALKDSERVRSVELRTHRVPARVTTAKARTMGIKERLSRFTTSYAASNKPRVGNIHLLADALDGTLIAPGATFSFNGTIGPRTAEKGYQEADAIVDGKLVPQLGGGICQVGTTIFNAVYESGVPVLERHNHSFYISHYPTGRDATVSWGGPDLRFKNDTDHWVLIAVAYTDSSLTIALYGTDPGYTVQSTVGPWENIKPFTTETTKDPTLPAGARIVEDEGESGRSITVTRTVTLDGQVVRTDAFRSVYKPKAEVVRLGTKAASRSKSTTSTAKP